MKRINAAFFVTWRLAGSLPVLAIADRLMPDGAKFLHEDRLLDATSTGPHWLKRPNVAREVCETLLEGERDGEYELGSWVLMPNHVHLINRPVGELSEVVRAIKSRTAKRANGILAREGQPFWAKDYYDHWIRTRIEEQKIVRYIERNPVKASLCKSAELWPWSSAYKIQAKPG